MSENKSNDLSYFEGLSNTVTNSLSKLPFTNLIGDPLKACVQAQNDTTKATLATMLEMGLISDKKNNKAAISIEFEFISAGRIKKMSVPLLTLVPINFIGINSISITFKATVKASSNNTLVDISSEITKAKEEAIKKEEESGSEEEENNPNEGENNPTEGENKPADVEGNKTDDIKKATEFLGKEAQATVNLQSNIKDKSKDNGADYSNKKDSTSTRESKYSIETTVDFALTAGPTDMPGGLAKVLEILNNTVGVYDPEGELLITEPNIKKGEKVYIEYLNDKGIFEKDSIKITDKDNKELPKDNIENIGNGVLAKFDELGKYTVTANKKKETISVNE